MNSPDTIVLIANYLEKIENQPLLRWRERVKSDPEQAGRDGHESAHRRPAFGAQSEMRPKVQPRALLDWRCVASLLFRMVPGPLTVR